MREGVEKWGAIAPFVVLATKEEILLDFRA
jgi:hypothetical protein